MVLGEILRAISAFFEALLRLFGMSASSDNAIAPNSLRVFIKYSGKTISTDLNPSWSIKRVKDEIAPKLGVSPEEIKIIFAGNELPDSFVLETSDVGQQSYLHAVRVKLLLQENNGTKAGPSRNDHDLQSEQAENLVVQSSTRTFVTNVPVPELNPDNDNSPTQAEATEEDGSEPAINTKSDFFVYCSTCDDLKEGKLRVRCTKCLSGAFTVSSHPQGWNDVLTPKQIQGICEVEFCDGHFASFYFKCSSHVTTGEDDSSPPLQQVKRNRESVPCLACGDSKEISLVFTCANGGHATCIDCFKQFALFKINQRDFIQDIDQGYTLGCPALCADSLITDAHHFKLMGKHQYDRYQRFATEECLIQLGGLFCPQPDCGMGIIPEDVNCNKIACLHGCGYVFCKKCLEGWHIGACTTDNDGKAPAEEVCSTGPVAGTSFNVTADRAAQAKWNGESSANTRALRLSTKPCPNCRVPTERAGGCMHMECTKCKFQWCWVCQIKWDRECMGNHWFG